MIGPRSPEARSPPARYIMLGGFLGSGKTTALLKLARRLAGRGLRVGLITNDQSVGLVDTTLARSQGFPVEEIAGGCFCCKFNSLVEAARRLARESRPDVFLAEPVGSCTDLKATVSYPLRRIYGDDYSIAPLSVLVDPLRALRVLGMEPGNAFSPKVRYLYRKQLEEAEIIAMNKVDLLDPARRLGLEEALRRNFPRAELFAVSARQGTGLDAWFDRLAEAEGGGAPPPDLDYDLYAEGEALLGWLNLTARLSAAGPLDGNRLLLDLARSIQGRLAAPGLEIAHLKMVLTPGEEGGDIGVLNLTQGAGEAELSHELREPIAEGELVLNLRAEGDPAALAAAAREAVGRSRDLHPGLEVRMEHLECFRPARPSPVHRESGI